MKPLQHFDLAAQHKAEYLAACIAHLLLGSLSPSEHDEFVIK